MLLVFKIVGKSSVMLFWNCLFLIVILNVLMVKVVVLINIFLGLIFGIGIFSFFIMLELLYWLKLNVFIRDYFLV